MLKFCTLSLEDSASTPASECLDPEAREFVAVRETGAAADGLTTIEAALVEVAGV